MLTDIIKRLASKSGKTMRQISDEMNVTEKTLKRMMSGDTGSPSLYTFVNFLRVCGADIDDVVDIFAEIQFFMVRKPTAEINQQNEELAADLQRARDEIDLLSARIATLMAEKEILREKNDTLRDELIELYRTGKAK